MIVSFDIGIQNLGYCIVKINHENNYIDVIDKGLMSFEKQTSSHLSMQVIEWLDMKFRDVENAIILIESQMRSKMRMVQIMISSYFHTLICNGKHYNVVHISPKQKLSFIPGNKFLTYSGRKEMSVLEVERLSGWRGNGKCDDICDAIMQSYVYCIKKKMVNNDAKILICNYTHA
jgi:hypothetical protein